MRSVAGRNLMGMFCNRERLRKEEWGLGAEPLPIGRTAVVGAGVMGSGIAWAFSGAGLPVVLRDIDQGQLDAGVAAARSNYDYLVERGRLTSDDARLALIVPTLDEAGLEQADLVVEAMSEDPALKARVIAAILARVSPNAIIATNTSSLPVAELVAPLEQPERFLTVHSLNPVDRMPLVEIERAPETSGAAAVSVIALARALRKTPIVVKGRAGFIVNRVLFPYASRGRASGIRARRDRGAG